MAYKVALIGYGYLIKPCIAALENEVSCSVLTPIKEQADEIRESGFEDVEVGDTTSDEFLRKSGIESAYTAVVASDNDADDALTILTVTEVNPGINVIAVASNEENMAKLSRAGADIVLSPAKLAGRLLAESALTGEDTEVILEKLHRGLETNG